jgi:hypothetical protein
MPSVNRAYAELSRHLVRRRRRDLLLPLLEARNAIGALGTVIELAERQSLSDSAAVPTVIWLKAESLKQRARFERAVHHVVVECISEADSGDLVDALLGGDDRLLADILLDG